MQYGDAEAAAVAIVDVAIDDASACTDLTGHSLEDLRVRVRRVGGTPTGWMSLDNARIEFACYGPDKGAALDLARATQLAIYAARGVYEGNGLRLVDVAPGDGLEWKPDEHNENPRYLFTLSLITRPSLIE